MSKTEQKIVKLVFVACAVVVVVIAAMLVPRGPDPVRFAEHRGQERICDLVTKVVYGHVVQVGESCRTIMCPQHLAGNRWQERCDLR